jgi:two-component system sensor histidine kinase HydH
VTTDPERLRAVLVNILNNAQHAVRAVNPDAAAAPAVRVRVQRADAERWRIEVQDRGEGIASDDVSRIFEPFFTTRRTGSGLGLALARNVIEGLGGSITVESQLHLGTRVTIELPSQGA